MGRPANVRPPPRAWRASGALPDLLQTDDLANLPQPRGRRYVAEADLAATAAAINETLGWYALWAAGKLEKAQRNEVRDWCHAVAKQAEGLLTSLALAGAEPGGATHEDVQLHLVNGWPYPSEDTGGPAKDLYDKHRLHRFAGTAQPEMLKAKVLDHAHDLVREVSFNCIGARLGGTLRVLQLLATRAGHHYAAHAKRGKTPEEARKHLFCNLTGIYERLFGCLPTVPAATVSKAKRAAGELRETLPSGPALAWFRALIAWLGQRAADARPSYAPGGSNPDPEKVALLDVVTTLAADAAKGKAADGLAIWIREATDERERLARFKREPIQEDDTDFEPTPIEELFP